MVKRNTISIYPEEDLNHKLQKLCEEEHRSLNQQVLKIIKDYFQSKEEEKIKKKGE